MVSEKNTLPCGISTPTKTIISNNLKFNINILQKTKKRATPEDGFRQGITLARCK